VIEHIEIENFKSLQKVSLDLGPLNIFVGTNASGKTNFLEALRVLQGIGYGYTVDEILNGRPKLGNTEAWEGIRGGSKYARFLGSEGPIQLRVGARLPPEVSVKYNVIISPNDATLGAERCDDEDLLMPDRSRSGLRQAAKGPMTGRMMALILEFSDAQFLAPVASVQREYSMARMAVRLGDRGENFAALLKTIQRDEAKFSDYVSWLKELTPAELDSIEILINPDGAFTFAFQRGGVDYTARVLSDGTLRFAAIAAAFFQPSLPRKLILEEIEDGLHPTRLQLLIELLKSQAGTGIEQVFATTHSPYTIAWLDEEDYRYVFLCTKDDETGATTIIPFTEVPHLIEVARRHPISDLLARGWLETAV